MADESSNQSSPVSSGDASPPPQQRIPGRHALSRRMLVRGAVSAAPVIMTLRSSPALASTGNQAAVQLTPHYDENFPNTNSSTGKGAWLFEPADREPWLGPNRDAVTCVKVDGNNVPYQITGYFDTTKTTLNDANAHCGGIIIAASSGGSFTH